MKTPSEAQFSHTFNTAEGGLLLIYPDGSADLGTSGKIEIAPQPGPATDVTVSASLFGLPGGTDATTGGNVCVGQGIEWVVSEPEAIEAMRVRSSRQRSSRRVDGRRRRSPTRTACRSRTLSSRFRTWICRSRASCRGRRRATGCGSTSSSSMGATRRGESGTRPGHFSASVGKSGVAPIQSLWCWSISCASDRDGSSLSRFCPSPRRRGAIDLVLHNNCVTTRMAPNAFQMSSDDKRSHQYSPHTSCTRSSPSTRPTHLDP